MWPFTFAGPIADLMQTQGHRLDEAYKGLIMLGAAFAYSTVLIGPYGWLKAAARAVGTPGWFAYAGGFLLLTLGIVPGIFWLCVHLGRVLSPLQSSDAAGAIVGRTKRTRGLFADYAAVLVPLGLAVWMAFTLSFALVNFSYARPAETSPGSAKWTQCSLPGRPSSSTSAEC